MGKRRLWQHFILQMVCLLYLFIHIPYFLQQLYFLLYIPYGFPPSGFYSATVLCTPPALHKMLILQLYFILYTPHDFSVCLFSFRSCHRWQRFSGCLLEIELVRLGPGRTVHSTWFANLKTFIQLHHSYPIYYLNTCPLLFEASLDNVQSMVWSGLVALLV